MPEGQQATLCHFDRAGARGQRAIVAMIHADAYAERIASSDPFASTNEFMARFDAYTNRDGFDLVIAYLAGEPVGQAWGWPLGPDTAWWRGLQSDVNPGFTAEDGRRTFALSELMVRRAWSGAGLGRALHDELLHGRPEQRATLLVRPENTTAYRAYLRWGWHKAAVLRPAVPHAPTMDVLMLELPLR